MRVIRHTSTELMLQERPWLGWIIASLFVLGGAYVALTSDEVLFGGLFVAAGCAVLLVFAKTVTCTFDRTADRFTREIRGVLGTTQLLHSLGDIAGLRVEEHRGSKGSRTYRVALVLTSGARIPLTTTYGSGKRPKEATAERVRAFLGLPAGAGAPGPMPGFGELVSMILDPAPPRASIGEHRPATDQGEVISVRRPEEQP